MKQHASTNKKEKGITALLYTRPEAAARLAISLRTLDQELALGNIPAVRIGRRTIRFRPESLDYYIQANETSIPPQRRAARQ